jgi:23S rRNA (adenine1618-N6)-methyltransferase
MPQNTTPPTATKENLHPRNLHRGEYNFKQLCKINGDLKPFVFVNQYEKETIDFTDAEAVKTLNKALLKHFYGVDHWDIPEGYLCPPIPGRADYIHYLADLLAENNGGKAPVGNKVKMLDIGTGATVIYPLIGNSASGWQFVGADIDADAINSARNNISLNSHFSDKVVIRLQPNKKNIFKDIIKPDEWYTATMCNPPFHANKQQAQAAAATKWEKLKIKPDNAPLNFGGQKTELWYPGGEAAFINRMAEQSVAFAKQCLWFTTLVSKKETLPGIYKTLAWVKAADVKTISMAQGQKVSRIVAWSFFTEDERTAKLSALK